MVDYIMTATLWACCDSGGHGDFACGRKTIYAGTELYAGPGDTDPGEQE